MFFPHTIRFSCKVLSPDFPPIWISHALSLNPLSIHSIRRSANIETANCTLPSSLLPSLPSLHKIMCETFRILPVSHHKSSKLSHVLYSLLSLVYIWSDYNKFSKHFFYEDSDQTHSFLGLKIALIPFQLIHSVYLTE